MKGKGLEQIDLPDGVYRARIGGNIIRIKTPQRIITFKADRDSGSLSIAIWVQIKEKEAVFSSRY